MARSRLVAGCWVFRFTLREAKRKGLPAGIPRIRRCGNRNNSGFIPSLFG